MLRTILLGDGVFTGPGNRDLMTHAWQYQFRSQSQRAENCIIDCQGTATDPHRAFYFSAATGATRIEYITFRGGVAAGDGGAIQCQWGASPTIRACIFEENVAFGSGGAIAVEHDSSPEINNCTFIGNGAEGYGGAMVVKNQATVELASCWFRFNAALAGGAVAAADRGDLTVVWSVFDRNEAVWGGGLMSYDGAALTVIESTLARNSGFTGAKADKAFETAGHRDVTPFLPGDKALTGGGGVFCGDTSTVAIDASIIAFDLPKPGRVSLEVFDISGRRIAVLIDGESKHAGRHAEDWTGRDGSGRRVAGGVYFYRLTTGDWTATKRMVLVK